VRECHWLRSWEVTDLFSSFTNEADEQGRQRQACSSMKEPSVSAANLEDEGEAKAGKRHRLS
jgi:hypothetical protein